MQIINHYSFVLLALAILALAAYLLLRKGIERRKLYLLGGALAAIVLAWLLIRPQATPAGNPMELYDQIGKGRPVLLEFQSPY